MAIAEQPALPKKRKRFSSPVPYIILAVVMLILIASYLFEGRNQNNFGVNIGRQSDFMQAPVTYVADHHLYIVQVPELRNDPNGGLRALADASPTSHCRLDWQPDTQGGVFVDPCTTSIYERSGKLISGSGSPILQQLPLRESGGYLFVLPAK